MDNFAIGTVDGEIAVRRHSEIQVDDFRFMKYTFLCAPSSRSTSTNKCIVKSLSTARRNFNFYCYDIDDQRRFFLSSPNNLLIFILFLGNYSNEMYYRVYKIDSKRSNDVLLKTGRI